MPGNVQLANFQCNIPRAAFAKAGRIAIYGHGLLFSRKQIDEDNIQDMSAEHDMTFCATDWSGMSEEDVLTRSRRWATSTTSRRCPTACSKAS
ncbi:MAG: hypothetical protein U0R70_13335 [Solirubrobacteraceae bacterium]